MEKENPVKDLRRLDVRRRGKRITIIAESSGFLYKMVRLMTGAAVQAAWADRPMAAWGVSWHGGAHRFASRSGRPWP